MAKTFDTLDWKSKNGTIGAPRGTIDHEVIIIGDRAVRIHNITAHTFKMGDVEDPDLYAAQPLWEWQESEQGKWIMSHAVEAPIWHRHTDPMNFGYQFAITAKLKEKDYTYWLIKWMKLST